MTDGVSGPIDSGAGTQELHRYLEASTTLETVQITPEIEKRIERARKTCDAEIIR